VQNVADWFNHLSESQKRWVVYIGVAVAALGPIIAVIGALAAAIGAIIAFAAPLAAIIGVIAAIVATVVAFIAIIKNIPTAWKELKESAKNWWEGMKADLQAFAQFFINIWHGITGAVIAKWNAIKAGAQAIWNGIKSLIAGVVNGIKANISTAVNVILSIWNGLRALGGIASSVFNAVKHAVLHPVETMKNKIRSIINAIKGFFHFSVPRPHIPLPHFSISPKGWRVGDLLKGSIPSLGLKWYKNGGIFNSASVIGVGEAGTEAVVPLEKLWNNLDGMKSEIAQSLSETLMQMVPMMAASMATAMEGMSFNVSDKELARAVAGPVSKELEKIHIRTDRRNGRV